MWGGVKMECSLINHDRGYNLSKADTCHVFCSLLTLTALPYALRHRELAQTNSNNWLGHKVLFVAECIPVIGIVVAAIEYLVGSHFHRMKSSHTLLPSTDKSISCSAKPLSQECLRLLQKSEDYFNLATIPAPLTFPEMDVDESTTYEDLIETLLKKYDGLCIGESHFDSTPKYFLTVNMPLFKKLGVDTLYIEGFPNLQGVLDVYFEGDTIELPQALIDNVMNYNSPDPDLNYTHNQLCYTLVDVIKAAKQAGIRIVNIDSDAAEEAPVNRIYRLAALNYQAKLLIDSDRANHLGGKSIIFAGNGHVNRTAGVPSLGQLYQFPSIEVADRFGRYFIDDQPVALPSYSLKKEIVEKQDDRSMNIDFQIHMNQPIKTSIRMKKIEVIANRILQDLNLTIKQIDEMEPREKDILREVEWNLTMLNVNSFDQSSETEEIEMSTTLLLYNLLKNCINPLLLPKIQELGQRIRVDNQIPQH